MAAGTSSPACMPSPKKKPVTTVGASPWRARQREMAAPRGRRSRRSRSRRRARAPRRPAPWRRRTPGRTSSRGRRRAGARPWDRCRRRGTRRARRRASDRQPGSRPSGGRMRLALSKPAAGYGPAARCREVAVGHEQGIDEDHAGSGGLCFSEGHFERRLTLEHAGRHDRSLAQAAQRLRVRQERELRSPARSPWLARTAAT